MSSTADTQSGSRGPRALFKTRAYDELRSRFDNLIYEPGTYLSERQLADELGMSKTPVKAALERLELEGFITVSPQSGIRVRELTLDEITQMYEIRVAIEGFVLKTISGKLTPEQLERWEQNLEQYRSVDGVPELIKRASILDAEFHLLPTEFLGNKLIINTMQQFSVRILHVINRVFSHLPSRISQSLIEHQQIVSAVRQGKGSLARELGENHLQVGHEVLCAALERSA